MSENCPQRVAEALNLACTVIFELCQAQAERNMQLWDEFDMDLPREQWNMAMRERSYENGLAAGLLAAQLAVAQLGKDMADEVRRRRLTSPERPS